MNEDALNPATPGPQPTTQPPRWRGLALAYVIVAGVVVVTVALVAIGAGWLVDQLTLYSDDPITPSSWPLLTLITALIVMVFSAPALLMRRMPRVFAVGAAWLAAAAGMAVFGVTRLVPVAAGETLLITQTAVFAVAAGALWLVARRFGRAKPKPETTDESDEAGPTASAADEPAKPATSLEPAGARPGRTWAHLDDKVQAPGAAWLALCAGGLTILPWAWYGALGSVWETVLAATTAIGFAAVAAFVLGDRYWARFAPGTGGAVEPQGFAAEAPGAYHESPVTEAVRPGRRPRRPGSVSAAARIWGGGSGAGVALLLLGSGAGAAGLQLPIMITLAALGFAIAAVMSRSRHCGRVVAAAVAPAVFGPLAFADGDEYVLAVVNPEIGAWAGIAVAVAVGIAWLCGLVYSLSHRGIVRSPAAAAGMAVVVAAACVGANAVSQPGFHGEKLFVVMKEQADLSGVEGDRDRRLTEVHDRLIDTATSSQRSLRAELDDRGLDYQPFYLVNAIEVDTGAFSRSWLEARADVDRVLLSPQLRPLRNPAAPDTGEKLDGTDPQPNIEQVGAPDAWQTGDGSGITIGISDSGVDGDHPAFADRFRGGDDSWADPVNETTEPNDPGGHGTHSLGLALGANGIGVAPGAEWIGCANLPRNAANPADYLSCLQFMLAPYAEGADPFADGDPLRAPHVLTNSWGCPAIEGCDPTVLGGAAGAFAAAGIFYVVSVGNSGPACGSAKTPPANDPDVYSVGAVNADGELASFSSRGPVTVDGESIAKPEISAPGVNVVSATPDGGYGPNTGTSMAGPHVAGAVAVLWSAVPELVGDIDATKRLLAETAAPVTATDGDLTDDLDGCGENAAGAGTVDVAAAVEAARQ